MDFRSRRTAPIGGANLPRYSKMRAEDFVRKYALSNRDGQSGKQSKTARGLVSEFAEIGKGLVKMLEDNGGGCKGQGDGLRGPLYRAVITCKVTECAPSSGASDSAGGWYGKQTARSRATRNGEPVGWRKDIRPTKKVPARRPVCGAMVIPSAWPGK